MRKIYEIRCTKSCLKKSLKKNRRYLAYIIYGNNKNSISNMFIVNDEKENVSFILDEKYNIII